MVGGIQKLKRRARAFMGVDRGVTTRLAPGYGIDVPWSYLAAIMDNIAVSLGEPLSLTGHPLCTVSPPCGHCWYCQRRR